MVDDLFKAFFRLFLGESKDEKDFRRGIDKAARLYQNGLRYNGEKDFREALATLHGMPDSGTEGDRDRYKKLKLKVLLQLKLCQVVVYWYAAQNSRINELVHRSLGESDIKTLNDRLATIAIETTQARNERERILKMQPTRKTEERLSELKEIMVKLSEEQSLTNDKIVSFQSTEKKRQGYRQAAIQKLGSHIEGALSSIADARAIKTLPDSEQYRAQSNLHRYFDQVKEYQELLQDFKAESRVS